MTHLSPLLEKLDQRRSLLAIGATPEELDAHWRGDTPKARGYTFHAYEGGEWRGYTRESLLDMIVEPMLERSPHDLAPRASAHAGNVRWVWRQWWKDHGQSVRLAETLGVEHVRQLRGDTLRALISAVSPPVSAVGASIDGS